MGSVTTISTAVDTERSFSVSSGTLEEGSLSCFDVATLPGFEDGCLESTSIGEGDRPGSLHSSLVDSVEVEASILFRLTSRKEHNSRNSRDIGASKSTDGSLSNLFTAGLRSSVLSSGSNHVRFDDTSLNDELVGLHLLHDARVDHLRDCFTFLKSVVSIKADLRLDDWYEAIVLSDTSVTSQSVSSFVEGKFGRTSISSVTLDDTSPLAETDTTRVVSLASLS